MHERLYILPLLLPNNPSKLVNNGQADGVKAVDCMPNEIEELELIQVHDHVWYKWQ